MKKNKFLIIGGFLSGAVSLLHIAMIAGGPAWYQFFGAGKGMAQLAENGSIYPAIITAIIASVLALWALYAFSGAGLIIKFPLLKPVLLIISMIFILRGIVGVPMVVLVDHPYLNELKDKIVFMIFSSVISLLLGCFYLKGTLQIKHTPFIHS